MITHKKLKFHLLQMQIGLNTSSDRCLGFSRGWVLSFELVYYIIFVAKQRDAFKNN